ncbi:MAG: glycosyltransferase family 2 protein [Lachnospiraceae bacterium]|nr:glycosyltransferase family 2 protein [Lachnospiraceae bacterium]
MEKLVSVIMPVYNCEAFVGEAIQSVVSQTYKNIELIIVDDCSTDRTADVIARFQKINTHIKYFKLDINSGAAQSRNYAIKMATGEYLAFLDSDDIWVSSKLERQIRFMEANHYNFTCTDYGKIDELGKQKKIVVSCLKKYDYDAILRDCPGNSTVIYDASVLGKFYAADIRRRNDFVMWLQVIKRAKYAYGLNEVLGYHRERENSISINKAGLIKYQWIVYRKIEKLSFFRCCFLMAYKIFHTVKLRLQIIVKESKLTAYKGL